MTCIPDIFSMKSRIVPALTSLICSAFHDRAARRCSGAFSSMSSSQGFAVTTTVSITIFRMSAVPRCSIYLRACAT